MLHKTRGIVLRTTRYGDTSVIVKVYTDAFGLQSYIVNGVHSAKSKGKSAMYQHGNLLDMVVYHKDQGSLMRISESRFAHIYEQLPFNVVKGGLLLFYIEVLNRIIKEEEQNEPLFDFLFESLIDLDQTDRKIGAHHIWFLLGLSKYLGFYPNMCTGHLFDLEEGAFTPLLPRHQHYISEHLSAQLRSCIDPELRNYDQITISSADRRNLLHHLLTYYKLHLSEFGDVRSMDVLETLFR